MTELASMPAKDLLEPIDVGRTGIANGSGRRWNCRQRRSQGRRDG
jgi:hypothetical protein